MTFTLRHGLFAGLLALLPSLMQAASTADAASDAEADAQRETAAVSAATLNNPDTAPLIVPVVVNGESRGESLLLRLADGSVLARREDWQAWRLVPPDRAPLRLQDGEWWDLRLAQGFVYRLDEQRPSLELDFAPAAFAPSALRSNPSRLTTATPPDRIGAYLNYELFASRQQSRGLSASQSVNALAEAVVFHPGGSFASQWLGLDLFPGDDAANATPRRRQTVRLDSNWQQDDPEAMTRLVLGDAIGSAGLYGRANRYGGVRYGRNFATQPGLITLPQPALSGESSLPSVLEVYVDGVRRDSQRIPAGPFSVTDIPAVNGQGQVQVVVRDLLGREQLLSLPYLSGSQQLKAGLHDYSFEAGWLRQEFGRRSNEYGGFAATTEHLYGLSDEVTVEGRLELRSGGNLTTGLGAITAVPGAGLFTTAAALSHEAGEEGSYGLLGWQRYFGRRFNLGLRAAFASRRYAQTGISTALPPPVAALTASAGFPLGARASLGLSYLVQRDRAEAGLPAQKTEAVTAVVSARVGEGALSGQLFQRLAPSGDLGLGLVYSRSFGGNLSGSAALRQQRPEFGEATTQLSAGVQRGLPVGEGWGWRAQAVQDVGGGTGQGTAEAGVSANSRFGSGALDVAASEGSTAYRATVSGSVAAFGGHVLPARRINSGFALVQTGAPEILVRVNNQDSARSNSSQVALLPDVLPYVANEVQVDAGGLPLDVELQHETATVTPYFRSGVKVALATRAGPSALVQLLARDGKPLPALSSVQLDGTREPSTTAREGMVFLTDLKRDGNLLRQVDGPCRWRIVLPPDAGLQPRLGPIVCEPEPP